MKHILLVLLGVLALQTLVIASEDAYGCWTCGPGYAHWYELGLPQPSDKCACVKITATTKRPCWTCGPGYAHWYDLGMAQPSDVCACVQLVQSKTTTPAKATTKAPVLTVTKAPTPATQKPTTALAYFLDRMTPNANSPGSISFSPGVSPYSPWSPPPLSLVGTLMDKLIQQTNYRTVMMYYMELNTLQLAKQRGLKVLGIVDLTNGDNTNVINNAISMARLFPDVLIALSCGNELGANFGMVDSTVNIISTCLRALRSANLPQPIGVIDTYYTWCNHQEKPCNVPWSVISNQVDWIGLNTYPIWENIFSGMFPCTAPADAAAATLQRHKSVQANYPSKPIVLTEFGWAGANSGQSLRLQNNVITGQNCGPASDANQKLMVQGVIDLYRAAKLPCNTFEAFRETWKATTSSIAMDAFWSVCQGTAPYDCFNAPK